MSESALKESVRGFWNRASCGEAAYLSDDGQAAFNAQAETRYALEPYIAEFARFQDGRGKHVLEVGVGLGADHEQWARAGAELTGVDLTLRAIQKTRHRLTQAGLRSDLAVADAENLPFAANSFDVVYSYGVIHHSPDTPRAAQELLRVLKPGGRFAVMIYHRYSLVGFMLWLRYALLKGRPFTPLDAIYAQRLESPGTKAYTPAEARRLFGGATDVQVRTRLSFGDLLQGASGQRHQGALLSIARALWPRRLLEATCQRFGLLLLIEGSK